MSAAPAKSRSSHDAPDLSEFRRRYPLTVASFGSLADRETWLRRIWEMDARWQKKLAGDDRAAREECIVRGAPRSDLQLEAEFDIIYAGGVLGLLHAAVMAAKYKRRVMVFDEQVSAHAPHGWNMSDGDLRELSRTGLFTAEEIEAAILNRYRSGFVKFHDAASRVKTPPLWVRGVLDVSIEADKLLTLAAARLRASETESKMCDGLRFVRAYVEAHRVSIEVEETKTGKRKLFAARLFVDATGAESLLARQLDGGRLPTHVCPTVGTLARGYVKGSEGSDRVDFGVGEILVSKEDARDHRQLIWEGLAGSPVRDEYATRLFFYDAIDSPADKSLLSLFERYFESLPNYKRAGAQWRVVRPVFGYLPGFHPRGWMTRRRRVTASERVLLIGEAACQTTPLTRHNFGAHARRLHPLTHLVDLALSADALDAASLSEINSHDPRVGQTARLAEFMRPTPQGAPSAVNETWNAVMAALHELDERVRRELFQDCLSTGALKSLLSRTAKLYPRIFGRVREHLGARGTFWWLAGLAESMLHERRGARREQTAASHAAEQEDAAREFARHVRLYQNERGANDV